MMPTAMKFKGVRSIGSLLVLGVALVLTACGGGSGGGNTANPAAPSTATGASSFAYNGPAPANADVQRFQQAFYNNLVNDNRCGSCHTRGGAGKTAFVDRTDVNFAYSQALTLVDLQNPAASKIVEQVYSGHNCWEASNAACRVQMIAFIQNWANDGGAASTSVKLAAPTDRDPNGAGGGFRDFPDVSTYGSSQLYALVKTYCSRCHSETSSVQQQPYFASSVVATSYAAIQSKVDLNDPALTNPSLQAKSRLVVRLRDEFHNCWTASCANDAATMESAIQQLAQNSPLIVLDSSVYRSKAQVLNDGIVGSSGGRFELYQIALWNFQEGEGNVISDTSGVSPAISLTINGTDTATNAATGNFNWIGGGGIQFNGAVAHGTGATSTKLYQLIGASGEYSIEAWTLPANTADKNREIIAYSDGTSNRNFMLGQTMTNYDYYNRSSATDARGMVGTTTFSSDPNKKALDASLQHVVATYDPINGRQIYVNGQLVSTAFPNDKGTLVNDWDQTYEIVMGNTLALGAAWSGELLMVAIHDRALNSAQIAQNFAVPPGEKRYVMFNVSQIANMPASCRGTDANNNSISYCYIYFEVSQYDNYAYLLNRPYFISLNSDIGDLTGLVIKGIHIGMNGQLATVGQAYVNVNATINTALSYMVGDSPGSGQVLADVGTVIPKVAGPDSDLLYLEFDKIGNNPDLTPAPTAPPTIVYSLDGAAAIDLGWRTFDQINETFAQMTNVPLTASTGVNLPGTSTPAKVSDVFTSLRNQLPAVEDFPAYVASHQTAVSQLAIAYCSALMQNTNLRHAFFTTNNDPTDFRNNWQNNFVNPLVTQFTSGNAGLASAPSSAQISAELMNLITYYPADSIRHAGICANGICNGNDALTLNAATAACAAGLANAALMLQ